MNIRIGSAPDSWGVWFPSDPKQTPWHRFLDEIVEAGYEWTELGPYGYMPTDPATLRAELDRRGLKVTAAFTMAHLEDPAAWPELERQMLGGGELAAALGGRFMVLIDDTYSNLFTGEPTRPSRLDDDGWKHLIDADPPRGRPGRKSPRAPTGLSPARRDARRVRGPDRGVPGADRPATGFALLRHGSSRLSRRRPGRLLPPPPRPHPLPAPEERRPRRSRNGSSASGSRSPSPWATTCSASPIIGAVDFLAFRDALREADYDGWATVEQDMYPAPFDKPLPIARRTRAYLRSIGLG